MTNNISLEGCAEEVTAVKDYNWSLWPSNKFLTKGSEAQCSTGSYDSTVADSIIAANSTPGIVETNLNPSLSGS